MKVELRVGAMSVSCETDYNPNPSCKSSENDAQRKLYSALKPGNCGK